MNDLYDRWITALESGTYAKGKGYLRQTYKYCCLGVACDLYDRNSWNQVSNIFKTGTKPTAIELPAEVQHALQLKTAAGHFNVGELSSELRKKIKAGSTINNDHWENSLVEINDTTHGFNLIIQVLKERPPSLFVYKET